VADAGQTRESATLPAYRAALQESPRYLTGRALMSLSRGDSRAGLAARGSRSRALLLFYLLIFFKESFSFLIGVKGKMRLAFDPFQEV